MHFYLCLDPSMRLISPSTTASADAGRTVPFRKYIRRRGCAAMDEATAAADNLRVHGVDEALALAAPWKHLSFCARDSRLVRTRSLSLSLSLSFFFSKSRSARPIHHALLRFGF